MKINVCCRRSLTWSEHGGYIWVNNCPRKLLMCAWPHPWILIAWWSFLSKAAEIRRMPFTSTPPRTVRWNRVVHKGVLQKSVLVRHEDLKSGEGHEGGRITTPFDNQGRSTWAHLTYGAIYSLPGFLRPVSHLWSSRMLGLSPSRF